MVCAIGRVFLRVMVSLHGRTQESQGFLVSVLLPPENGLHGFVLCDLQQGLDDDNTRSTGGHLVEGGVLRCPQAGRKR